ncbi:hypothetical protein PV328_011778 [Microctonus aethiopoides]|uniref:Uncharacterized protein n=1 Tax=Microctonus aethiopoides TaxID=144406 RepID=A0AA39FHQ9_9HYME|nr:hypothetical protein PV328_011778 [Microctonus aethiopoides]
MVFPKTQRHVSADTSEGFLVSVDINNRQCLKVKKKVWTDVIAYAFWEQYHLTCAFIFNQGRISFDGSNFVTIDAHCKSKKCNNRLLGYVEDIPSEDGPVFIKIKCRDTRDVLDHEDLQRPLQSENRKTIGKKPKDLGVHGHTRQVARQLIRLGDTGCPFLYKPNILYQAKKQCIDNERGVKPIDRKDMFAAIDRLNDNPIYRNTIHARQNTDYISFWLQTWIRLVKTPPHEAVSDGAPALLNAMSR